MKYLSLLGLTLVIVFALATSGLAVPMTLFFDNNDLDLGAASRINLNTQYQSAYGLWFQEVYRYIDPRDPFVDPYPDTYGNFGISNGFLQQNGLVSTQGRVNFLFPTPYLHFDWWTIPENALTIEAFNSVGISQGSLSGLSGFGTNSIFGDISYIKFNDAGGFVQLSNIRYDSPIPEPGTLVLLGTGLLGLGAFRYRRKK